MSLSRGLPQVTRGCLVMREFDGASVGPHAGRTGVLGTPPVAGAVESTGRSDPVCQRWARPAKSTDAVPPAAPPRHPGPRRTAYGERVTIDPGLPVALAVVLLLTLTVTMYLVGRLPKPGSTLFAAARAIVQLSIAALVIAAVIKSLVLSLLLLAFMFVIAVVTTVRRVEAPKAWPWATLAMLAGPAAGGAGHPADPHRAADRHRPGARRRHPRGQHDERPHAHLPPGVRRAARGEGPVRGGPLARADPGAVGRRGGAPPGARGAHPGAGPGAHGRGRDPAGRVHRGAARVAARRPRPRPPRCWC